MTSATIKKVEGDTMSDKVQVRIFGQEYSVIGDKSQEQIQKIAEYVDEKMHTISKITGRNVTSGLAVLSAINIAEEYFDNLDEIEHMKTTNEQLEKDANYYMKMWEDSKKNYMQSKDNMAKLKDQGKEGEARFQELEKKCNEYENSIFDLQMENIQLKSELEKLQKE